MTKDEMIFVLENVTQFSPEYLKTLSLEKIEELYKERIEK